jgi:hypothetical protein
VDIILMPGYCYEPGLKTGRYKPSIGAGTNTVQTAAVDADGKLKLK